MNDFHVFMPIAKIDKEKRTVSGYASTPAKDSDGEIVTLQAIKKALPGYMAWGNIREMHKLSAVGSAQEANVDSKGLFLTAKIVDDTAWKKCLEGVYKGFSIGGRKLDKSGNKITEIDMTEISVVDRPANPECSFTVAKREKDVEETQAEGFLLKLERPAKPSVEARALSKMAKIVGDLAKAGPPAAKDGFSLPALPDSEPDGTMSQNDSRPNENVTRKGEDDNVPCEAHGKIGCEKCAAAKTSKLGDSDRPYGDVPYADEGLRPDGKKRYPIDTVDHIRAAWNYIHKKKNAAKYTSADLNKVKNKIVAAWKAHVNAEGPPSMDGAVGKSLVPPSLFGLGVGGFLDLAEPAPATPFLTLTKAPSVLTKGMQTAGSLSYVFDSLRNAQRSLLLEGKREGGDNKDKALADKLGSIAKELAGVIGQKALHEGSEATDLSDADDAYVNRVLGESTMSDNTMQYAESSDPLAKAILDVVKRAAMPTRAQRMADAKECVKKSRMATKEARKAVEECHKMHKAAFLSKTQKAAKGDKGGDDEFDHAGAMEKLQKAYQEIDKARTFGKAAMAQMDKMSGRSGQDGQEVSDANEPFYEVPPGIKDLTPEMMARLGPGSKELGTAPIDYSKTTEALKTEGAGNLAKYVKNGAVPAAVMELLLEKAQTEGELAALRRMPMSAVGGRRPMAFDTRRLLGETRDVGALNKAIFDGVDVGALNGQDEQAHTAASARAIGNFIQSGLFAKSVFDPSFKGAAAVGNGD